MPDLSLLQVMASTVDPDLYWPRLDQGTATILIPRSLTWAASRISGLNLALHPSMLHRNFLTATWAKAV